MVWSVWGSRIPNKGSEVRSILIVAGMALLANGVAAAVLAAPAASADTVYRNGYLYTVDATNSVQHALAVRAGRIVYVDGNAGVRKFIGSATRVVDLHGRMMMPGLVDGHLHPLDGGLLLTQCNLNYEALSVAQFQARIQSCLDKTRDQEPDGWLDVGAWFQSNMIRAGVEVSFATLDGLKTRRPILPAAALHGIRPVIPRDCSRMLRTHRCWSFCRSRPMLKIWRPRAPV